MPCIPGLRSPYDEVGGLVCFGRTLDKIRLHAAGALPEDYHPMLGVPNPYTIDGKSCRLLGVSYEDLTVETLKGGTDEGVLEWAFQTGRRPTELEIEVSNAQAIKQGWRDELSGYLKQMVEAAGYPAGEILTFADFLEYDEGRPLRYEPDPSPFDGEVRPSAVIPGLRSPYEKVGGLVHFGRMVDKIRLSRDGMLPEAWGRSKGIPISFDGYTCTFLALDYAAFEEHVLGSDAPDWELLEWAYAHGRRPDKAEIRTWNAYLSKRGWRDKYRDRLHLRLKESGMPENAALTMFDFIDLDEGRPLRF